MVRTAIWAGSAFISDEPTEIRIVAHFGKQPLDHRLPAVRLTRVGVVSGPIQGPEFPACELHLILQQFISAYERRIRSELCDSHQHSGELPLADPSSIFDTRPVVGDRLEAPHVGAVDLIRPGDPLFLHYSKEGRRSPIDGGLVFSRPKIQDP